MARHKMSGTNLTVWLLDQEAVRANRLVTVVLDHYRFVHYPSEEHWRQGWARDMHYIGLVD